MLHRYVRHRGCYLASSLAASHQEDEKWINVNVNSQHRGLWEHKAERVLTLKPRSWPGGFLLVVVKDTIILDRPGAAPRHSGLFGSCRVTLDNGRATQTNTPASRTGNWERSSSYTKKSPPNGFHLFHEYPHLPGCATKPCTSSPAFVLSQSYDESNFQIQIPEATVFFALRGES